MARGPGVHVQLLNMRDRDDVGVHVISGTTMLRLSSISDRGTLCNSLKWAILGIHTCEHENSITHLKKRMRQIYHLCILCVFSMQHTTSEFSRFAQSAIPQPKNLLFTLLSSFNARLHN